MEDEGDSCRLSASGQPKEPMWPIIVFHEGFEMSTASQWNSILGSSQMCKTHKVGIFPP